MKENLGNCTKCGSQNTIKNGHNNAGKQQYQCKDCNAHRILESEQKYSDARKWKIIQTYLEGSSLRGLGRIFHIAYQTPYFCLPNHIRNSPTILRAHFQGFPVRLL